MAADYPLPPMPGGVPLLSNGELSQEWLLYFQRLNDAVKELQSLL